MPKITACVIVKNEEKNLPRWFSCVRRIADEFVVVDTGSDDGTERIAAQNGARLLHFKWRDDFSAAKNFAVENCGGDWIVFPDADEIFSNAEKVRALIEKFDGDKMTAGFFFRWVNIEDDGSRRDDGVQLRVFRNLPELRFVRTVHEFLKNNSSIPFRMEYVPDISILHTGHASSALPEKLRRNLRALEAETARCGEKPENLGYFADCYYGLGDYENTLLYAKRAAQSGIRALGQGSRPYILWLRSIIALRRPVEEAQEVMLAAEGEFPKNSSFRLLAGVAAAEATDYLTAEEYLTQGIEKHGKYLHDAPDINDTDHAELILPGAYWYLADISHRRGDDSAAMSYVSAGLSIEPGNVHLIQLLGKLLRGIPPADAAAVVETSIPNGDPGRISSVLAYEGLYTVSLYYERKSGRRIFSDYERFLFAKKYYAAARSLEDGSMALLTLALLTMREKGDALPFFPRQWRSGEVLPAKRLQNLSAELACN